MEPTTVQTLEEYVDSRLEQITPLGVAFSKAFVIENYPVLDEEANVRVSTFSTPAQVHNEALAEANANYSHSHTFRLKAIEARLLPALKLAFAKYGEDVTITDEATGEEKVERRLDLAFISPFLMSVNTHVNVGQNDPVLPMKGDPVVVQVRRARESAKNGGGFASDRMGNSVVLNIAGFSVPPVREARKIAASAL